MKVYACPAEVPEPVIDYANYPGIEVLIKLWDDHAKALKAWLIDAGYTGPHTGKIVYFPVGDGNAQYMLADGPKSCLIHLPYGDAWEYRDIGYLPKKAILERIKQQEGLASIFSEK